MSWLTGALALFQASASWVVSPATPTVGDTIRLTRELVVANPQARVQLQQLEESPFLQPLRDPEVVDGPEGFSLRYMVAAFRTGEQRIDIPEIELVLPDGSTEALAGGIVVVRVASVLPEGDSLPPPYAARDPVPRTSRHGEPAMLLGAVVVLIMAVWGYNRRRPAPRPVWGLADDAEQAADVDENPVLRWVVAGEPRAVAALTMHRLRDRFAELVPGATRSLSTDECLRVVAKKQPDWPIRAITDVVQSLERASFAPAVPSDIMALSDEADELMRSLEDGAAEASEETT